MTTGLLGRRVARLLAGTPWWLLGGLALALSACAALVSAGWLAQPALRAVAITAGYGGMLATAVGWAAHERRAPGMASAEAVCFIGGAALATAVHPAGAVLYLATPVRLWVAAARGQLIGLALGTSIPTRAVAVGIAAGLFLGLHLLICAALTFGHRVQLDVPRFAAAFALDAGAQVVATECFYRGALLNRLVREWSFATSAAWSTAACLVRYLVDPLLPASIEIVVGMVFYVSLVSVTSSWLFWRSGSLVPGSLTALLFFAAYRLLVVP